MIDDTRSRPSPAASTDTVVMTAADYSEALRELEVLRAERRVDADDEGLMELRITHLERLIASATVVEAVGGVDGVAGLGSFVRVRDESGRETEYELVGRRGSDATTAKVTLASPVGKALVGAREGDDVRVELPNGRRRPLTVVAVGSAPSVAA